MYAVNKDFGNRWNRVLFYFYNLSGPLRWITKIEVNPTTVVSRFVIDNYTKIFDVYTLIKDLKLSEESSGSVIEEKKN